MTALGPERIRKNRMEIPNQSGVASDMPLVVWASICVRNWARVAAVLAVLTLMAASLRAGEDGTAIGEYQLKAVFLFNFAKFVEWPPQAFGDARDPFAICVAGDNPFGSSLEDAVRGRTVANRPISIRLVSSLQQSRTCQILFIAASERSRMGGLLKALKNCSVLTVGDTDDFTANGGIVQFKVIDARVRIEIDAEAAQRANLRISSKLLSLAEPAKH
jgi:hypothetical protein